MPPKMPSSTVTAVEYLLREQISACGDSLDDLSEQAIATNMKCTVHPDGSLLYAWKGDPILHVIPIEEDGSITWRMFTKDDSPEQ